MASPFRVENSVADERDSHAGCIAANSLALLELRGRYLEIGIAILICSVMDVVALVVAGLWNGLKCRSINEAISYSLTTVILAPVAVSGVLLAFGFRTATLAGGVFLWVALCLIADALTVVSARWMLEHRFRQTASS